MIPTTIAEMKRCHLSNFFSMLTQFSRKYLTFTS